MMGCSLNVRHLQNTFVFYFCQVKKTHDSSAHGLFIPSPKRRESLGCGTVHYPWFLRAVLRVLRIFFSPPEATPKLCAARVSANEMPISQSLPRTSPTWPLCVAAKAGQDLFLGLGRRRLYFSAIRPFE